MNGKLPAPGLRVFVLSLAVTGLAACASTAQKPSDVSRPSSVMTTDEAYIAYVERVARRRGIEVTWVNMPRTRVPVEASED